MQEDEAEVDSTEEVTAVELDRKVRLAVNHTICVSAYLLEGFSARRLLAGSVVKLFILDTSTATNMRCDRTTDFKSSIKLDFNHNNTARVASGSLELPDTLQSFDKWEQVKVDCCELLYG